MVFDDLLGDIDGGNVLDVGCGTGQFTGVLAGSLKSYSTITGVDVDEVALEIARQNYSGKAFRFVKTSSLNLPFRDGEFDMVVISQALHHVEDPRGTLDEMKRVLRKNGYFLINEVHRNGLTRAQESHALYHHLRADIDKVLGINHNHTFYREDLIRLGSSLGLRDPVMVEFSKDESGAKEPGHVREFIRKVEALMEPLDGHPGEEEFSARVEGLKNRFLEHGISRPPQFVILGRK